MSDATVDPQNITTPNLGLNKPLVGGDEDIWGGLLNANCDVLDTQITDLRTEVNSLSGALLFIGTYDVVADYVEFSGASGFPNGPLPPAGPANFNSYLITTTAGTGHGNAPPVAFNQRDWLVSDGVEWVHLALGTPPGGVVAAATVTVTPAVQGQTNVQTALQQLDQLQQTYLPLTGGTLTGPVRTALGNASTPALQVGGVDAGFWKLGATMSVNAGGATVMQLSATAVAALVPVTLPADPTANLQAATKQYVDTKASVTLPVMNGTAAVGTFATLSRADHVHPSDTSRAAASALGNYLPLAGGTLTGGLNGTSANFSGNVVANANLTVIGAAGTARQIVGYTADAAHPRWALALGDPTAEGGGNAGSDFGLTAFSDTGSSLGTKLAIARSTSIATHFGPQLVLQDPANNPVIYLKNNAGTAQASLGWGSSSNQIGMYNLVAGSNVYLDGSTSFYFSTGAGNAFKPGGGAWGTTSDARIKIVDGDYQAGLAEVRQLRPVRYRYKGNDSSEADGPSSHAAAAGLGRVFVGLVAQEAETVFPGMVKRRPGFIDGAAVEDLRELDNSELVYALVNAVKELKAEIEALKAAKR